MGWFDKRSWRLSRKIKDLQADLRQAEEEGKFVVQDGLFFAELADMGEMTMMAFGTDLLAAGEESVIRSFFDRNGFTVDKLQLDKSSTGLAAVEILPSEEMTRSVARVLKTENYKLVDDSDKELAPNLQARILTLSAVMRSMTLLFAERAEKTIINSNVKMNKEGNRLLHWLPKIVEALDNKVDRFTVEIVRPGFEMAYDEFYGHIGAGGGGSSVSSSASGPVDAIPAVEFPVRTPGGPVASAPEAPPARQSAPARQEQAIPPPPKSPPAAPPTAPREPAADKAREAAEARARMFRALVGANASRCVRNCEALLKEILAYFQASAACVLVKLPSGEGLGIHAQAGEKLAWGTSDGMPISVSAVTDCVRKKTVVTHASGGSGDATVSMIANRIDAAAACPLVVADQVVGVLYIDRRNGTTMFRESEKAVLESLAEPFRDFPELTLGIAG